ncbi:MAG: cupin domain-containing protein [Lachnospiraceae bacterium]
MRNAVSRIERIPTASIVSGGHALAVGIRSILLTGVSISKEHNKEDNKIKRKADKAMMIDFKNMEETILPGFKGGEKEYRAKMFADEQNRIMHGRLIPGASIGLHTHEDGSEIIYILEGEGKAIYDGAEERVYPGSCHYCPKGHSHTLINDTDADLIFFAVVAQQ